MRSNVLQLTLLTAGCATAGWVTARDTEGGGGAVPVRAPVTYWKEGMTLPRPVDPDCVGKGLDALAPVGGFQGPVGVRFVVFSDGRPASVRAMFSFQFGPRWPVSPDVGPEGPR